MTSRMMTPLVLIAGIWIGGMQIALAEGDSLVAGEAQAVQENYEEALPLLLEAQREQGGARVTRLLGLTYYHMQDYGKARPLLAQAVATVPGDHEARYGLGVTLLALGEVTAATEQAEILLQAKPEPRAHYLAARAYLAANDKERARQELESAVAGDDVEVRQRAATDLVQIYAAEGRIGEGEQVAQQAIAAAPDSLAAVQLRSLSHQLGAGPKPFTLDLGYRLEHDSNVILEPNGGGFVTDISGKSDTRHVFLADIKGQRRLSSEMLLFGEGHLYHGLLQDLSDFDETRQNYVLGLGWSKGQYGFRLPYELNVGHVDGDHFLTSHSLAPGAYVRLPRNALLYGFGRITSNDYDQSVPREEELSGTTRTLGAMLLWPFHGNRGAVRLILQGGHDDTDGSNWERDQLSLFAHVGYQVAPKLRVGVGLLYDDYDYDNTHTVYLIKREDDATTLFGTVSYALDKHWELQAQASRVRWDSNIDVYAYDRNVVSVGVTWHY